jgi:penicillin-binding protein 1A
MPNRRILRAAWALVAFAPGLAAQEAAHDAVQEGAPARGGQAWQIIDPPQSTLVYAADGSAIGEFGNETRTSVPLSTLPPYVPQAFIAIEDHRFYEHDGVDVVGVLGAIKDRMLGRNARGASTITQQLVGNMHPDLVSRREHTLDRKLREQAAAREMERHYSKAQILEAYLNQILFGHGWYGIDAAARHYFGVPASELTLAQAATLAALPKGPAEFDPVRYPQRARRRRNLVLTVMANQRLISRADAARAARERLVTIPPDIEQPAPYFVDAVRAAAEGAGVDVGVGGFRIYSTLDTGLQRSAVEALATGAAAIEARKAYPHPTLANHPAPAAGARNGTAYLQGMIVALDPSTGEVRALVGGRKYQDSPFNRAVDARRQAGSAFKPIVYAAAIGIGLPANTIVYDTALAIPLRSGRTYRPMNADRLFLGRLTLREALAQSRNTVAVQLGERVGLDSVVALAHRMGISTPIAPVLSTALGAATVRPIDLVAAYAAFATLGTVPEPQFITRIEDRDGREVWSATEASVTRESALDSGVAFIVRDMLRDVVDRGTAAPARRVLPAGMLVAGKTGTTNDNSDVWFIGMTPGLVAGVWLGFDRPQSIVAGAAGGTLAAPIWAHMMAQHVEPATEDSSAWARPAWVAGATLDRVTGVPADSTTPAAQRYTEYFLPGTEPGLFYLWSVTGDGVVPEW